MADGRCLMLLIDRRVMQRNSRARAGRTLRLHRENAGKWGKR